MMRLRILCAFAVGALVATFAANPARAGPALIWALGTYPGSVEDCAYRAGDAMRSMDLDTQTFESHANGNEDNFTSSVQCFRSGGMVAYVVMVAGDDYGQIEAIRDQINSWMRDTVPRK